MRIADEDSLLSLLREYWGYSAFRGIQPDIIRSIMAGHDTLGLMPTGGGKSVCFQVPALAQEGVCIVVTPLIALMKDQVQHLLQRGIRATAVYAGLSHDEILLRLENCVHGGNKFLYVSPERLGSELFQIKLRHMKVSFITVDEAHCISQWGYDFRPAYLEIARLRKLVPHAPVLALTATATPRVVDDICRQLDFRPESGVFRMSFERSNLSYVVRHAEDKYAELLHILRSVPGSAIVYTRSRQGAYDVARQLEADDVAAFHYHAGLTHIDKDVRQQAWQAGEVRVMVATNAFGMGIDKPDVRLVVHMDLPDSVEAYFQEAGRAGRDGNRAYAVLLYNGRDKLKLHRRVPDTFPDKDYIRRIYDHLAYYYELALGDGFRVRYEFNLERFCQAYRFFPVPAENALRLLTRAGYIDYQEAEESRSRVLFLVTREELYRLRFVTPLAEEVIRALLRTYGGLFSNYVFIEESVLAHAAGVSVDTVYEILKELNRQGILHFIPRKCVPYITFMQRRVSSDELELGPDVYEDRRRDYEERIRSIVRYAESDDCCRSEYLLRYFGDENAHACGHCDVCLDRSPVSSVTASLRQRLLHVVSDGQPHSPASFRLDGVPTGQCAEALRSLVADGKVLLVDGYYVLASAVE